MWKEKAVVRVEKLEEWNVQGRDKKRAQIKSLQSW